jgi:hypothetical protein
LFCLLGVRGYVRMPPSRKSRDTLKPPRQSKEAHPNQRGRKKVLGASGRDRPVCRLWFRALSPHGY